MRYILGFLLGALLLIVIGLSLGLISLDFTAPEDRQLTATGALAYFFCYSEDNCVWEEDDDRADVLWDGGFTTGCADEGTNCTIWEPTWDVRDPYDDPYFYSYDDPYDDDYYYEKPYSEDHVDYDDYVDYYDYYPQQTYPQQTVRDPWYVRAFPGFGQMAQQIIPGQRTSQSFVQPIVVAAPTYVVPPPPQRIVYPQPSCWISAQPMSVAYGGSSVLQWSSFNATRASLSDIGQVPTTGTRTVSSLASERIYSLSVSGEGGSGSCYTRITVQPPASAIPSCIISAHPATISRGQNANLAWGSNSASSALLSGVGAVQTQGGMYVAPQKTILYTLTVYGSSGRPSTCTAQAEVLT